MKSLFVIILILVSTWGKSSYAQCVAEAGEDKYICVDKFGVVDKTELNGNIISGTPPYTYSWEANYTIGLQKLTASFF